MKTKLYIQDYPCKCSDGDMCYIVRGTEDIDVSYPTRIEAEKALEKLRRDNGRS